MNKPSPQPGLQTSSRQPCEDVVQVKSPSDVVIVITPEGILEMCSQETASIFGYFQASDLIGRSYIEWVAPEDQEDLRKVLQSGLLANERNGRLSLSLLHREGRRIPVELTLTRIAASLDEHSRWIAWMETPASLTESQVADQSAKQEIRSATEEALRQSEERLRMIVSNVPVILFAVDCSGRFTLAEGKALSMLGQKSGPMVGKTIDQVFPNVPELKFSIRRAMNGDSFNTTLNMTTATFELWCSPIRDSAGETQGMLSVAFDVTEQKKAEEALRKSEERYRSLVENQGEGACIITENFHFEYLNLATEAIVGRPVSELIGHSLLEILPEDQIPILENQLSVRQKGKSGSYELVILRPDGERRSLLVTATPRFDATGKYIGSFAIFRDITDRKRFEDRLRYWGAHDSLTGLYNRFTFEEELHRLEKIHRPPVAAIIVDIDNLKEINDAHGHHLGDEAIRRVALALRLSFRVEDMIARIGGDEFAILLANTGQEGLAHSIERLRQNLTAANLNWDASYPISISIGGMVAQEGQSLQETLALADRQMYQEKQSKHGRHLSNWNGTS
ncbi:MAG: PAS domain S-box protein [Anaerolineae bacterium]|nr:PAS domain S-box protein [Anaerolineae bacterium]